MLNANDCALQRERVPRAREQVLLSRRHARRPGAAAVHAASTASRNKLFFFTGFEYLLPGAGHRTAARHGADRRACCNGNFSPAEICQGRQHHAVGPAPGQLKGRAWPLISRRDHPGIGDRPEHAGADEAVSASRTPIPIVTSGYNYVQRPRSSTRTTRSGCRAWITASATTPSCSSATICSAKCSCSRSACGGGNDDQVPYPTPVQGKNRSDSVTASLTHVFSPTMTNEFVFGYTFIGFPNVFADPVEGGPRPRWAINYKGLFKNGVAQIPSIGGRRAKRR